MTPETDDSDDGADLTSAHRAASGFGGNDAPPGRRQPEGEGVEEALGDGEREDLNAGDAEAPDDREREDLDDRDAEAPGDREREDLDDGDA
ncbi:MAG: hypothetical protein V5A43_05375, partial [Haloarculaceae archaeon]